MGNGGISVSRLLQKPFQELRNWRANASCGELEDLQPETASEAASGAPKLEN